MATPGGPSSLRNPQASCSPVVLAGPTAVGKSEISLRLAERLGGEIVSFDSMQVYRGLDLGTAKPSAADQTLVPHHLVDVADLAEGFDAAKFARLAHAAVREISTRGRLPIFCGGTGLYLRAYLEGLGESPPANAALRAELEAMPREELLRELASRDPVTFERIDRQNPRRVIRALEVIRLTGRPFSEQRAGWSADPGTQPGTGPSFGFSRSPADLRARINARVETMFQRGLVAETRALLERGLAENRTARQAIGYRQVIEHLQGVRSLAETLELVKVRTWQYARRQMTWFRRQARLTWIELRPDDTAAAVVERLTSGEFRLQLGALAASLTACSRSST